MAAASARASPTGTMRPLSPSRTTSGTSPTGVATTGRPSTSASASTSGPDSHTEGMATTSATASSSGALSLGPTRATVASRPLRWISAVSSLASGPSPTMATRSPRPVPTSSSVGLDQRRQALLRVEAGDAHHEGLTGAGPEALTDLGRGPDGHRRRADGADHADRAAGVLLHVAADLGRDRDQRVGPPEHGPLQHPHDAGGPAARLVEDQVVDGDDDGRPSPAPPPADHRQPPRLEAVGVHDPDPAAAGLRLPQPPRGAEQPARLEAGGDRDDDVDRPDAVEDALGPGHDDPPAVGLERGGERADVAPDPTGGRAEHLQDGGRPVARRLRHRAPRAAPATTAPPPPAGSARRARHPRDRRRRA